MRWRMARAIESALTSMREYTGTKARSMESTRAATVAESGRMGTSKGAISWA